MPAAVDLQISPHIAGVRFAGLFENAIGHVQPHFAVYRFLERAHGVAMRAEVERYAALAFHRVEIGHILEQRADVDVVQAFADGEAGYGLLRIHADAATDAALIQVGRQRVDVQQPVMRLHV